MGLVVVEHFLVEVGAFGAADVVLVVGVDEVVDLLEVVDAALDELQRVLEKNYFKKSS